MTHYNSNNNNQKLNRYYYQNKENQVNSYSSQYKRNHDVELDTLIIDGNTVYEIDDDCIKNHSNSSQTKKYRK